MVDTSRESDFFEYVRSHYDGPMTLEISLKAVRVNPETLRPTYFGGRAILSMGIEKGIWSELQQPDTIRFGVEFDAGRDGEMAWEEAIKFSVGKRLDNWFQGSSALLEGQTAIA